jgi:phosphoheptose isomerase
MTSLQQIAATRIQENIALGRALLEDKLYLATVWEVGEAMSSALAAGRKVLFFGNGGSAADAQHLAAELAGRFLAERHSLPGGADPHRTHSVRNSRKEIVLRRKGVKALFRLAEREFFVAQEVVKNTQAGQ